MVEVNTRQREREMSERTSRIRFTYLLVEQFEWYLCCLREWSRDKLVKVQLYGDSMFRCCLAQLFVCW